MAGERVPFRVDDDERQLIEKLRQINVGMNVVFSGVKISLVQQMNEVLEKHNESVKIGDFQKAEHYWCSFMGYQSKLNQVEKMV